ncbi:PspC domain-containing protein [Candidatus Saccharibacteria bacterium]|nr:PspC domain-containing protein [Candidatus Saccharibacteria bacterium]
MSQKKIKNKPDIELSTEDKKVGGVAGGIAEYYQADPEWVRVLAVIFIILTGVIPGLIVYGVFYALMKKTSESQK